MTQLQEPPVLPPLGTATGRSLGDSVYEALRTAILDGTLPPGTRIVEETIARQMAVSRAPLRQALWLLKRDGLIVDESARTTRVVTLDAEAIRELHLTRTLLETAACQRAAQRISSDEVDTIERVLADMQAAADAEDRAAVARLDYEFHQTLCRASGMPRLVEIWERQHVLFRLWLNMVGETLVESVDHIAASHRAIFEAVLDGDPDRIYEHVLEHVYLVGGALRTERRRWALEQPRVTAPPSQLPPSTASTENRETP
ncbi:MAG TPA: GntR family transcriptional regulator [Glycomyces sp.]|nr:GntR family transcriptional regulator [Glycomyces sp.]